MSLIQRLYISALATTKLKCLRYVYSYLSCHNEMSIDIGFNEARYVKLLEKLIGETKHLQDNPPRFVPEEDR